MDLHDNVPRGEGAANESITFLDAQELPDPEGILTDPSLLVLPRRGDLAVAIIRAILARVETNNSVQRWEQCCDVFEATYGQNKEVAMAGYGKLWKLKPDDFSPARRDGAFAEMDRLRNRSD